MKEGFGYSKLMLFSSRGLRERGECYLATSQMEHWCGHMFFFMLCISLLNNQFFHIIFTCVTKSAESLAKHQQIPASRQELIEMQMRDAW